MKTKKPINIRFILNDALNKALLTKHRIKGVPDSNKIAEFVDNYIENDYGSIHLKKGYYLTTLDYIHETE